MRAWSTSSRVPKVLLGKSNDPAVIPGHTDTLLIVTNRRPPHATLP